MLSPGLSSQIRASRGDHRNRFQAASPARGSKNQLQTSLHGISSLDERALLHLKENLLSMHHDLSQSSLPSLQSPSLERVQSLESTK